MDPILLDGKYHVECPVWVYHWKGSRCVHGGTGAKIFLLTSHTRGRRLESEAKKC